MASFLTNVLRSVSLTKSHSLRRCGNVVVMFQRNIYGDNYLAIDGFLQQRERVSSQYHDMKDKFIVRMKEYLETDPNGMVFTEDLKHMVHLAENKPEDIALLINMAKKFHSQSSELRFGRYIFGPVIMRLFHHIRNHEVVYQLLKDDSMTGFFDQIISFTIGMDLLFKCEKYQQVLDLFEVVMRRNIITRFPRDPMVLLLASCYKLNTPDSLMVATRWLQETKAADAVVLRKAVTFAAALALKQNNPSQALEILSSTIQQHYFTVKNLKIVALVQVDRVEEALRILRNTVERDIPDTPKRSFSFSEETLSVVKEAIDVSENKEHSLIFQRLEKALRELNIVSKETLDESLCSPILNRPLPRQDSGAVGFESKFFVPGHSREQKSFQVQQNYGMRPRHGLLDSED